MEESSISKQIDSTEDYIRFVIKLVGDNIVNLICFIPLNFINHSWTSNSIPINHNSIRKNLVVLSVIVDCINNKFDNDAGSNLRSIFLLAFTSLFFPVKVLITDPAEVLSHIFRVRSSHTNHCSACIFYSINADAHSVREVFFIVLDPVEIFLDLCIHLSQKISEH